MAAGALPGKASATGVAPHAAAPTPAPEQPDATTASPAKPVPGGSPRDDGPPQLTGGQDINWGRQLMLTVVWLLVICGAAWGVLRLFYQRSGMLGMGVGRRRLIRILDRHILSPQKSILILEVGSRILVVGVAEQQMTTLAELDPEDVPALASQPAEPARPVADPAPAPASSGSPAFPEQLTSLFGRRNPPT